MIISNNYKIIYVHIQKTGGSTVSSLMAENFSDTKQFLNKHDQLLWGKMSLLQDWDKYFKFTFVRNPWDRLVSWYSMILLAKEKGLVHRNKLWQYVLNNSTDFSSFVANCTAVVDDFDGKKCLAYNQLDYIANEEGEKIVDFVGRYETFEKDLKALFRKFGKSLNSVPQINVSSHSHYSTYYTATTKQIVADRFSRDIEFFGYQFESP